MFGVHENPLAPPKNLLFSEALNFREIFKKVGFLGAQGWSFGFKQPKTVLYVIYQYL